MPVHASSVISTTINTFDSEFYTALTDMENNQYTLGVNGQLTEYQPLFQTLSDDIITWMNVDRSAKIADLVQGLYSYKVFIDLYGTEVSQIAGSDADVLMGMDGVRKSVRNMNLMKYTEEFDHSNWNKTRASITADAAPAPDGSLTADKIIEDTTVTSTHQVTRNKSFVIGVPYTLSVYAKSGSGNRYLQLAITGTAVTNTYTVADLENGIMKASGDEDQFSIEDVGDGWYRLSLTITPIATATAAFIIRMVDVYNAGFREYTGDGTSYLYIWGAQLVKGSDTLTYHKNVATSQEDYLTRYDDYPTLTFTSTTITRSSGSWITDGFVESTSITVSGSTSNNGSLTIAGGGVAATVLTITGGSAETDSANVIVTATGARMSDSTLSADNVLIKNAFVTQEDPDTDAFITAYLSPIKTQTFTMLFADVVPLKTLSKDDMNTYIFDTLHYRTVFDNMNTGTYVAPTAPS